MTVLYRPTRSRDGARALIYGAGLFAFVGGLASFLGWAADIPRLTDWYDNGISIQPNTTVAVMVTGAAMILLAVGVRRIAGVLGVLVAVLGLTALIQYVTRLDFPGLRYARPT